MITVKLKEFLVPDGVEPQEVLVTFDVMDIAEPSEPNYIKGGPVCYQGVADQFGHIHDDIISPESFVHIVGCLGYEADFLNDGIE